MRKFIAIFALLIATVAIQAQVTAYNSYLNFPSGSAQRVILSNGSADTIAAHNTLIYATQQNLETSTDTVTGNKTINVTLGPTLKVGSLLYVEIRSGSKASPFTVAFADGCVAITVTPTASKIQVFTLMYNGTAYRLINKYNCN
jgi:hypothetical protein